MRNLSFLLSDIKELTAGGFLILSRSEEDNNPLSDDAASTISLNIRSSSAHHIPTSPLAHTARGANSMEGAKKRGGNGQTERSGGHRTGSRARHAAGGHLSGVISDDGVDSPTYDGDIETTTSTRTVSGSGHHGHGHHQVPSTHSYESSSQLSSASGSVSTLTSPTSATFPSNATQTETAAQIASDTRGMTTTPVVTLTNASGAGVVVDTPSVMQQQPVNVAAVPLRVSEEPEPVPVTTAQFSAALLSAEIIRAFVNSAIKGGKTEKGISRNYNINEPPMGRPVRIYADGSSSAKYKCTRAESDCQQVSTTYFISGMCSPRFLLSNKTDSVCLDTHYSSDRQNLLSLPCTSLWASIRMSL